MSYNDAPSNPQLVVTRRLQFARHSRDILSAASLQVGVPDHSASSPRLCECVSRVGQSYREYCVQKAVGMKSTSNMEIAEATARAIMRATSSVVTVRYHSGTKCR